MLMMPVMVFGQRETIMTQDTIILYGDTIIIHEPWDRTMHDPWYPMGLPDDYVKEPTFEEKLNSLLQDYKQYCEADSILVGYEFVIAEGESFRDAWRVYNVDYIRYFGYAPYDNFDYMWGTPDKVWKRRLEKTMYDSYRDNTYIRCEDIRIPKPITLEGLIEWMENKAKNK